MFFNTTFESVQARKINAIVWYILDLLDLLELRKAITNF